jgi:hypothetical protein
MKMSDYPQYGAQGMDFILNDFMTNPEIRDLVESKEKKYGHFPKSVLCSGKKSGTYAVDSDKYLDMQKKMKRLATVIGRGWSSLSTHEKGMVRHEYEFLADLEPGNPKLDPEDDRKLQAAIQQLGRISDDSAKWDYYRKAAYPYRNTLYKTSTRSWKRFSDDQILEFRQRILDGKDQE